MPTTHKIIKYKTQALNAFVGSFMILSEEFRRDRGSDIA